MCKFRFWYFKVSWFKVLLYTLYVCAPEIKVQKDVMHCYC